MVSSPIQTWVLIYPMANLTVLRSYASMKPSQLPSSVLFSHTDRTMTIFDAYPKSIFHFLILPRVAAQPSTPISIGNPSNEDKLHVSERTTTLPPSVTDLSSLRALLNSERTSKDQAKEIILSLKEDALRAKKEIEGEMEKRYGFIWDIWIGFHAVPSMEWAFKLLSVCSEASSRGTRHIHLHVLSADLCSERMKIKKHYNSFHPKLGFFLHVDQILSWFDAEISYFENVRPISCPQTDTESQYTFRYRSFCRPSMNTCSRNLSSAFTVMLKRKTCPHSKLISRKSGRNWRNAADHAKNVNSNQIRCMTRGARSRTREMHAQSQRNLKSINHNYQVLQFSSCM